MKRSKALFQIMLMLSFSIVISVFNAPLVSAQEVCCEKTTSDEFCQYVDQSECAAGLRDPADPSKGQFRQAPTSCENTNFCRAGCCFDKEGDGYCYSNYPRSNCELAYGGRFSEDTSCEATAECDSGCCVLGTQAFLSTEVRCQSETSQFPDLEMDFRRDIDSEIDCTNIARSAEKGCCVTGDGGCSYGTRQECTVTDGEITGFQKDKFCSEIGRCSCAPGDPSLGGAGDPESTMCVEEEDSVYWRDSCGNREGVKEVCDYATGSLCGDSDEDGRFTCESLECSQEGRQNEELSTSLPDFQGTIEVVEGGVENGESWCQYDRETQEMSSNPSPTQSPVGSRYYRSICINGKELVEPCKDYRQEFCVSGTLENVVSGEDYTESRCIPNEFQSCIDQCNTADPLEMEEREYQQALEDDRECCLQIDKRDCAWTGRCVPAVGPGLKHWEEEGSNICGAASTECPVVFVCNGFQALFGQCEPGGFGTTLVSALTVVAGAAAAALIAASTAGAGTALLAAGLSSIDLGLKEGLSETGWHVVSGQECLSQDYVQATNNLCRSYGDCGANINYEGKMSLDGFSHTVDVEEEFREAILHADDLKEGKPEIRAIKFVDDDKVGLNPGELGEDYQPEWPAPCAPGATIDECALTQPFYMFTFPDGASFGDRFVGRAGSGWGSVISFVGFQGGAIISAATISGITAGGAFGAAGPLGALLGFVSEETFAKGAEQFTVNAIEKTASETASKAFTDNLAKGALDKGQQEILRNSVSAKLEEQGFTGIFNEQATDKLLKGGADAVKGDINEKLLTESLKGAEQEAVKKAGEQAATEASTTAASFSAALGAAAWVDLAYEVVNIVSSKSEVQQITATCSTWAAPATRDEDQCEQCNPQFWLDEDGNPLSAKALKPCSEYRCRSLGASCSLINVGTEDEQCVSTSKFDVNSPQITVYEDGFEEEYRTALDVTPQGITITREIPIYNRIPIGIQTDEPAQCKMSFESGNRFEDMQPFFFGGTSHKYFHIQQIFYPSTVNVTDGDLTLGRGGGREYTLFVRCEDAVGNANEADYFIRFNVGNEPDATAPVIRGTSIGEDIYVIAGTETADVDVLVNEPSECRWSLNPLPYGSMPEANECVTRNPDRVGDYACRFVANGQGDTGPALTGLPTQAGENKFIYFKCKDLSENGNFNQEPYKLTIRGSTGLNITSIQPRGEIKTSLLAENLTLQVRTSNGARLDGTATCRYTNRESLRTNIAGMDDDFLETNSSFHEQPLTLPTGRHAFFAGCVDEAGNTAFANTTFSILGDSRAPTVLKTYRTEEPSQLVVILDELATCEENIQTPDFTFGEGNRLIRDGVFHFSLSTPTTPGFVAYHIKCQDEFGNTSPVTTVSIIE